MARAPCQAALLNEYFARHYEGKLIVRFDDTNPSKEKEEFEHAILEDLERMQIKADIVSHTSDWFDELQKRCVELIQAGKAYVDDTQKEQMRAERMDGIASKCRDQSVEENLRRWDEMVRGTPFVRLSECFAEERILAHTPRRALRAVCAPR